MQDSFELYRYPTCQPVIRYVEPGRCSLVRLGASPKRGARLPAPGTPEWTIWIRAKDRLGEGVRGGKCRPDGHEETPEPPRPDGRRRHEARRLEQRRSRVVRAALSAIGIPYAWGGSSRRGFDCSGLVRWAYARVGISLPHSSYALVALGRRIPRSAFRPGDLLFFANVGHVGIYVGNGRMVHAPRSGRAVSIDAITRGSYATAFEGARRLLS